MLDRKTPPPLPTASPISSVVPPPLPKTIAIPAHPPLPIEKSEPVQVAVPDDERVELVTSDELFALPPLPASSPTQSVPALVCPAPEVPPQALPMQPIVDARAQPSKKKILWGVAGVAGLALIVVLSMFVFKQSSEPAPKTDVASKTTSVPVSAPVPAQKTVPAASHEVPPLPAPVPGPANVQPAASEPSPTPAAMPIQPSAQPPVQAPQESAAATKRTQSKAKAPNKLVHLEGAFFLFGNSIKNAGNGYRFAYAVLNTGIAAGEPLADRVKSQVFRVVVNCPRQAWGYDQRFYHALPFGEGERLDTREWQPGEVKWKPFRDSLQDTRLYDLACR